MTFNRRMLYPDTFNIGDGVMPVNEPFAIQGLGYYTTRNGQVVELTGFNPTSKYPWTDANSQSWMTDGRFLETQPEHHMDIVAEFTL